MESATQKMDYYDKLESIVDNRELSPDELFDAKMILIDEIISNGELSEMDIKDLLQAVIDEL